MTGENDNLEAVVVSSVVSDGDGRLDRSASSRSRAFALFNQIESPKGQFAFVQFVTLLWNSLNNTPLYYNTFNKSVEQLGLYKYSLDQFESTAATVGFEFMVTALLTFFVGNQRKYSHDALKAIFPQHEHELSGGWLWSVTDFCNAWTKSLANAISAAQTFINFSGLSGAAPVGAAAALVNCMANNAYYHRDSQSWLACLPDGVKAGIQHFTAGGYSISSALLYVMSMVYFRGHLEGNNKTCFEDPDVIDWLTIAFSGVALVSISSATFARYSKELARYLDRDAGDLPGWLNSLCQSKINTLVAALCKTLIALSSTFAFLQDKLGIFGVDLFISIVGALGGLGVQYGVFAKQPSVSDADSIAQSLINGSDGVDYGTLSGGENAEPLVQPTVPNQSCWQRCRDWCASWFWSSPNDLAQQPPQEADLEGGLIASPQ